MEIGERREFPTINNPTFVLLLGPSGVGKSEILKQLTKADPRIVPSIVYTDREAREDDFGKVSVSSDEFSKMDREDKFLTLEEAHGHRYGILSSSVFEALEQGKIPVQDYPEQQVLRVKNKLENTKTIYIIPPTLGELHRRGKLDGRDSNDSRFLGGREELLDLVKKHFQTDNIDDVVINKELDETTKDVLSLIYKAVS
jgi:guanylate kinase